MIHLVELSLDLLQSILAGLIESHLVIFALLRLFSDVIFGIGLRLIQGIVLTILLVKAVHQFLRCDGLELLDAGVEAMVDDRG